MNSHEMPKYCGIDFHRNGFNGFAFNQFYYNNNNQFISLNVNNNVIKTDNIVIIGNEDVNQLIHFKDICHQLKPLKDPTNDRINSDSNSLKSFQENNSQKVIIKEMDEKEEQVFDSNVFKDNTFDAQKEVHKEKDIQTNGSTNTAFLKFDFIAKNENICDTKEFTLNIFSDKGNDQNKSPFNFEFNHFEHHFEPEITSKHFANNTKSAFNSSQNLSSKDNSNHNSNHSSDQDSDYDSNQELNQDLNHNSESTQDLIERWFQKSIRYMKFNIHNSRQTKTKTNTNNNIKGRNAVNDPLVSHSGPTPTVLSPTVLSPTVLSPTVTRNRKAINQIHNRMIDKSQPFLGERHDSLCNPTADSFMRPNISESQAKPISLKRQFHEIVNPFQFPNKTLNSTFNSLNYQNISKRVRFESNKEEKSIEFLRSNAKCIRTPNMRSNPFIPAMGLSSLSAPNKSLFKRPQNSVIRCQRQGFTDKVRAQTPLNGYVIGKTSKLEDILPKLHLMRSQSDPLMTINLNSTNNLRNESTFYNLFSKKN